MFWLALLQTRSFAKLALAGATVGAIQQLKRENNEPVLKAASFAPDEIVARTADMVTRS
jgi:hypothetical protein